MRKYSIAPIAVGVLLALAGSAQAATKTTGFTVSATVAENCFVSATNMNFGSYSGVAALTATSSVAVSCTSGWNYTLALSTGGGTYAQRLLSDGGTGSLQYNLYSDAANTAIWGDGTGGSSTVGGTGQGLSPTQAVTHLVHGTLPNSLANQDAPAGSYSDSITVTITY